LEEAIMDTVATVINFTVTNDTLYGTGGIRKLRLDYLIHCFSESQIDYGGGYGYGGYVYHDPILPLAMVGSGLYGGMFFRISNQLNSFLENIFM
jgi:hypothetical protein